MKNKPLIIGVVLVGLAIIIGVFLFRGSSQKPAEEAGGTLPASQRYEKVEPGVKVSVKRVGDGRRVDFQVSNILKKYKTIEYEFSYQTGSGGLQGGIGSPSPIKNNSYQKEILLGTCSAGGACTYDEGVEKIKFTIFFSTGSDKRYLEKEFDI